ncbi:MAG: M50 family metallopeptidase [Oscillospiraceae bacterium]|nr:M50 family metallopeptidase [Oscillospiraceae bacterium]
MPHVVDDIRAYLLFSYKTKPSVYAIGSISRDKFIEVGEASRNLILYAASLMDGKHSYEEIEQRIAEETGKIINTRKLFQSFEQANLAFDEGNQNRIKSEYESLSIKIIDFDLSRLKKLFVSLSGFSMPLFVLTGISIFFTVVFALLYPSAFRAVSILGFENHIVGNLIIIIFLYVLSIVLHELAHGIVGSRYGLMPKKLTISLYLGFSPIIYIKVPGLYTIKPRERILVWCAGVAFNALLACIGFMTSILLRNLGNGLLSEFFLRFGYLNAVFSIVNLCPLLPLDGYFLLSTICKAPNLRRGAFVNVAKSFQEKKLLLSPGQCVYFVCSALMMGFVIYREVYAMVEMFTRALPNGIYSAFWSIKQYLLLILFVIVRKIIKSTVKRKKSSA